ncbi:hypothetical protein BaRGS_00000299, partial [Batillaria attramentaria]
GEEKASGPTEFSNGGFNTVVLSRCTSTHDPSSAPVMLQRPRNRPRVSSDAQAVRRNSKKRQRADDTAGQGQQRPNYAPVKLCPAFEEGHHLAAPCIYPATPGCVLRAGCNRGEVP